MQYVRQAGSDPSFLLKALGEASGELRRSLSGLRRRQLLAPARIPDDGWCLLGIAVHMRDVELGTVTQVERILMARTPEPEIAHVDLDDIPLLDDIRDEDEDEVLEAFRYYRRTMTYTLWDIGGSSWEDAGIHPYRGRVTVTEIVRELYRHDLEHLWQARRIIDAL